MIVQIDFEAKSGSGNLKGRLKLGCDRPFIYYHTLMNEPDYECPRCNSDKHVTVP